MVSSVLSIGLRIVGLGAVLSAVSEVWFYPVSLDSHIIWLSAFYGPLAYVAWLISAQTRVRTWAGAFWAACLFGFFIEGIPVPVLYEALPFTILWTSVAWHALISVGLGLWGFRALCARQNIVSQIICCSLAGLYLGAWSVELWSLKEETSVWTWTPTSQVVPQFVVGWMMFALGHFALDIAARFSTVPLRAEVAVFATLATLLFAANMLIAAFPMSLILPILTALAVILMRGDRAGAAFKTSPFLVRLSNQRVPFGGYVASALIPIVATGTYYVLQKADLQLESAAIHILWAGPVSIGLMIWSVAKILRQRQERHSQ